MRRSYSRLAKTEEKKNLRKAYLYILLTIVSLILLVIYGLPALAKMAAFLSDLRGSSLPVEQNDTTPPAPPRIDSLPEATKEQKVEVKGTTEAGATVVLTLNGEVNETLADKDGQFSYTFPLKSGENIIVASSKDKAGNSSQDTDAIKILYDNQPPELEITSPEDNSNFYGSKQRQVVIEGKTEENSSVFINDRFVSVEDDGSFTFATTLEEGENKFTIKAEDKAGNTSETTLILHFSL
jgi:hypothetical protein